MPPDPPRKLTPSALRLGIVPTPRSLWVMNNKCRGWKKILSNKLTLNFTHLQFGIGLHRGAQIIHRSRAQKSPWKCSNCQTAAFIFGARGYGTGANILIGQIVKLSHFWFLENVSVDDWQDLCLLSILHYFNKNFSEKKCKKFHVNCMLLSERIGVRVSWQSCDACHVILRIKRFCHFQFRLSSAASSGGLTIMQFSLILVIFSFISLSQAVLR